MEQRLILVNYADSLFKKQQEISNKRAIELGCFDEIFSYNREWLETTEFYQKNKLILDQQKGGGFCAWKPYVILETLSSLNPNDIILYMDSADWLEEDPRQAIFDEIKKAELILTKGIFLQSQYTKRDCFVLMDCDSEKYYNDIQIEAGVIVLKNTETVKEILDIWQKYCLVPEIITDIPNKHGENLPNFIEIRYDQSVLSNLKVKLKLYESDFIRNYIICNKL